MSTTENNPKDFLTPSLDVLQAFNVTGELKHLTGGEGRSYLIGNIVLKPTSNEEESVWRADLLSTIPQVGFRLANPVKTNGGKWVYRGWEASNFVEGEETKGKASEKIAVSRMFHAALKSYQKPTFIENATHPWAIADRMVWGEQELMYSDTLGTTVQALINHLKPVKLPNQLIHGDMTGNILFHEKLDPAIIDFSPYWRPAEYATAVIIVDSIVWNGGRDSLLNEMEDISEMNQLLVRAVLWRITTTEEFIKQYGKGSLADIYAYRHIVDLLKNRNL